MDFCEVSAVNASNLLNDLEVAFESDDDECDLEVELLLESDDDDVEEDTALSILKTTVANKDGRLTVVEEQPKSENNISVSLAVDCNEIVFESDDDEFDHDQTIFPHLRVVVNKDFSYGKDLAGADFGLNSKSIILDTTVPPATPENIRHSITLAATIARSGKQNALVRFDVSCQGSFCKVNTIITSPDPHGIYWCPYPNCKAKSRKTSLLKVHLKKTHHGPFYCAQCGKNFLHLPSLNRHTRKSGHSRWNDDGDSEDNRRHTVAAIARFSVYMYEGFASAPGYILIN